MKQILVKIEHSDIDLINAYEVARCFEVPREKWNNDKTFVNKKIYVLVLADSKIVFRKVCLKSHSILQIASDYKTEIINQESVSRIFVVTSLEKSVADEVSEKELANESLKYLDLCITELKKYSDKYSIELQTVFKNFKKHNSFSNLKREYENLNGKTQFKNYPFHLKDLIQNIIFPAV